MLPLGSTPWGIRFRTCCKNLLLLPPSPLNNIKCKKVSISYTYLIWGPFRALTIRGKGLSCKVKLLDVWLGRARWMSWSCEFLWCLCRTSNALCWKRCGDHFCFVRSMKRGELWEAWEMMVVLLWSPSEFRATMPAFKSDTIRSKTKQVLYAKYAKNAKMRTYGSLFQKLHRSHGRLCQDCQLGFALETMSAWAGNVQRWLPWWSVVQHGRGVWSGLSSTQELNKKSTKKSLKSDVAVNHK